jgi:hypothetical protein
MSAPSCSRRVRPNCCASDRFPLGALNEHFSRGGARRPALRRLCREFRSALAAAGAGLAGRYAEAPRADGATHPHRRARASSRNAADTRDPDKTRPHVAAGDTRRTRTDANSTPTSRGCSVRIRSTLCAAASTCKRDDSKHTFSTIPPRSGRMASPTQYIPSLMGAELVDPARRGHRLSDPLESTACSSRLSTSCG